MSALPSSGGNALIPTSPSGMYELGNDAAELIDLEEFFGMNFG